MIHKLKTCPYRPISCDRFDPRPRGVPKAFLISLTRTPDRMRDGMLELAKLGMRAELVAATDGQAWDAAELPRDPRTKNIMQAGETALCMSFWRACCRIVKDDLPWALIFEDDVQALNGAEGLYEALSKLPKSFHFAHLNDATNPAPVENPDLPADDPWMAVLHPSYVTVAYCVSNEGARAVLKGLAPFDRPIDAWLRDNEARLNFYQVRTGKAWFTQSQWRPSTVRESNVPEPIPRIIHRIWVGGNPMPAEFVEYGKTWEEHHPGYQFRTWSDEDLDAAFPGHPAIAAARALPEATRNAAVSDVGRLVILEACGGLYVDTDFQCFHNFDRLLQAGSIIMADIHEGMLCNGWMAAAPGNPWISTILREATARTAAGEHILKAAGPALMDDIMKPLRVAWPKPLTDGGRVIATGYGDTGLVVVSHPILFPYYWNDNDPGQYGDAWAVHHWARSWWGPKEWADHMAAHPNFIRREFQA